MKQACGILLWSICTTGWLLMAYDVATGLWPIKSGSAVIGSCACLIVASESLYKALKAMRYFWYFE